MSGAPSTGAPSVANTADPTDRADTAVYLYGVARGLDPAELRGASGVAGAPVRGVVAGGLTALVSTVRLDEYGEAALRANLEDLAWLEATARAHHDIVDRAAHAAPTAPVRIATIYQDDDRVAEVLAAQAERFRSVLDRLTGRTEWGVKAWADPAALDAPDTHSGGGLAPSAEPPTGPPSSAQSGSEASRSGSEPAAGTGTAYLLRRQRERRRREDAGRRAAEHAGTVHADLADLAVAARRHAPQDPRLSGRTGTQVLNAAYLLDDDRVDDFLAAARAAGERLAGVEVEVTGPWPPYSFIGEDT
ncbi:GvpL/GvpF family gas vesicle protein [Actinomadura decatromicini]|uniref:GvpL/GvpF family gas vesicle protein n=1 Tax=Actinomadura decatromicini TaxID=2604572 RepID=A0A5D3FAS3_9ACTN|nr:GvpL/GvpF family gas vesicle protein [Actinomadura decatromicini]TYK45004.1 GvpL/GvpF family gas vesicle protein [Actinomadura decatromicini]